MIPSWQQACGKFLRAAHGAVIALALATTLPAWSHHSYAMFDNSKKLTLLGTVAKVEWTNPHITIWAYVIDPKAPQATPRLFAFETGSPNVLTRLGWKKDILNVGEKETFEYFPLKDEKMSGGSLISVTRPDGKVLVADAQGIRILNGIASEKQP